MGLFSGLGGAIGKELGSGLGGLLGGKKGASAGGAIGGELGKIGGELAPGLLAFKNGGRVPGKKGRPRKAIVHGGEYILPAGVAPTMAQKKKIASLRAKGNKKK